MVVSGVVESIGLVGWVGLEASVGVVIACHGSGGRAGGLRSSRGGCCGLGGVEESVQNLSVQTFIYHHESRATGWSELLRREGW